MRASQRRTGGGAVVGGVLVGGMRRAPDFRYWKKQGTDVARAAALSHARLASESQYERDMIRLKAAIRAGHAPQGTTVRQHRALLERDALARVQAVQRRPKSMALAAGTALLVIAGVWSRARRNSWLTAYVAREATPV